MAANTDKKKNGRRQTIGTVPTAKQTAMSFKSKGRIITQEMYDKITAELQDRTAQLSSLEKKHCEMVTNFKSLEDKLIQHQNETPVSAPSGTSSLVSSLQSQLNEAKQEALKHSRHLTNLQHGWSSIDLRLSEVERKVYYQGIDLEEQKQYSMRNDLLLKHLKNLPVKSDGESFSRFNKRFDTFIYETLNELLPNLESALTLNDIDTSHVLYEGSDVVLVRFSNRRARNDVYFNKRDLKGNADRIIISEHLTKYRQGLLNFAMRTVGKRNAWSKKCEVFIKIRGTIHPVWYENEVLQLHGGERRNYNRRQHSNIDIPNSPSGISASQSNHSSIAS